MSKKDKIIIKEQEELIKSLKERNTSLNIQLLAAYQRLNDIRNILKDIKNDIYPIRLSLPSDFLTKEGLAEYVYDIITNILEEE